MAESHNKKPRKTQGILQLFFKQAITSFLCGVLFFLMNTLPVPVLNNCAKALREALRYETKTPVEKIPEWVKERFAFFK